MSSDTEALMRVVWPRAVVDARDVWWLDGHRLAAAALLSLVLMGALGSPLVLALGVVLITYAWRKGRVQRLRLLTSVGSHTLVETADARLVQALAAALNQDPTLPGAIVCSCGRVAWPGEQVCPLDGEPLRGAWRVDG